MATTIQDNVNNYYFKNQADFEAHKTEIPNNSTIYIEETGEVNVTINGTETENIEDLSNIVVGDKTYKVTGGGTSISTNGLNVTQEVLWTNPNPNQNFVAQSVNLSSSKASYDYILFSFYNGTGQEKIGFKLATPTKPPRLDMPASDGAQVQIRQVNYIDDITVRFENGILNGSTDNTSIIPYQIIGLKFLDTLNYSTEEQYTGKHWIDGKKIYQKTYYIGDMSNSEIRIDSGIVVDRIINISGNGHLTDGIYQNIPSINPYYSDQQNSLIFYDSVNNKIGYQCGSNIFIDVYITIQYTKTTE